LSWIFQGLLAQSPLHGAVGDWEHPRPTLQQSSITKATTGTWSPWLHFVEDFATMEVNRKTRTSLHLSSNRESLRRVKWNVGAEKDLGSLLPHTQSAPTTMSRVVEMGNSTALTVPMSAAVPLLWPGIIVKFYWYTSGLICSN
jgi:hypothetical protein